MKIIKTRQRPVLIIVDVLLTMLAWLGLLYLLIEGLSPMIDPKERPNVEGPLIAALGTLQIYLWVATLNAFILISWARYQHRKSKSFPHKRLPAPIVDDSGIRKSFNLSSEGLEKLRQLGSMTIHNTLEGDVSHVVTHLNRICDQRAPSNPEVALPSSIVDSEPV